MNIETRREMHEQGQYWVTGTKHPDSKKSKREQQTGRRKERREKKEIVYEMFKS